LFRRWFAHATGGATKHRKNKKPKITKYANPLVSRETLASPPDPEPPGAPPALRPALAAPLPCAKHLVSFPVPTAHAAVIALKRAASPPDISDAIAALGSMAHFPLFSELSLFSSAFNSSYEHAPTDSHARLSRPAPAHCVAIANRGANVPHALEDATPSAGATSVAIDA
jgi:hypothetical protein